MEVLWNHYSSMKKHHEIRKWTVYYYCFVAHSIRRVRNHEICIFMIFSISHKNERKSEKSLNLARFRYFHGNADFHDFGLRNHWNPIAFFTIPASRPRGTENMQNWKIKNTNLWKIHDFHNKTWHLMEIMDIMKTACSKRMRNVMVPAPFLEHTGPFWEHPPKTGFHLNPKEINGI